MIIFLLQSLKHNRVVEDNQSLATPANAGTWRFFQSRTKINHAYLLFFNLTTQEIIVLTINIWTSLLRKIVCLYLNIENIIVCSQVVVVVTSLVLS